MTAEDVYVQFMKKHFPDVFTARKKAPQADIGVRGKHKDNFFLPSVGNDYDGEIEDFLQNSDDECDERDIPLTDKTSKSQPTARLQAKPPRPEAGGAGPDSLDVRTSGAEQHQFSPVHLLGFQQKLLFPRTTQLVIEDSFGGLVRRLREPWDLYGLTTKRTGQLACWPQECEVIKERIRHIEGVSLGPEPLYVATGLEQAPIYTGPEEGEVVYVANKAYLVPYFTFSRVSGSRKPLKQAAINLDKQGNTLIFEARFESGNLQKVFKVGKHEYNLILRTDLYTAKHTQWYYFRVQNTEGAIPYRFTIINLMKPTSLYNMGMKPLMYSTKDAEWYKLGWRRVGSQIKYYPNNYGDEEHRYYSLTWTFEFPHNADTCYFAHCYPYTYSDLQDYLIDVANDPVRSTYCKVRVLCRSLAGNMVYILTVTNPSETPKAAAAKKAVVLTARVHPGETNSSWMMKGFLDCLLGNSMDAKLLRDTFLFKIVPMLNPDGVIVGNYRCSLTGQDLNRKYRSFLKDHYAPVWYTRKLIKRLFEERDVFLYCDLHGHSRKQNIFMYGCQSMHTVSSCAKQRVLPLMLSKNCCNKFSLRSCKFHVQRAKEGTGRVVAWRMGIANSYTLEATFCGSTLGNKKNIHFSVNDLVSVGFQFCDTLLDYCDPDQSKYIQCTKQLRNQIKKDIAAKMETPDAGYDSDASFSDILSYIESSTTGSNSSESDDPPLHFVTKEMPKRKTQLKTKKQRQNSYLIRKVLNTAKHYQVFTLTVAGRAAPTGLTCHYSGHSVRVGIVLNIGRKRNPYCRKLVHLSPVVLGSAAANRHPRIPLGLCDRVFAAEGQIVEKTPSQTYGKSGP
uniref:cytosolic carboxypeptidase 2-like n=1 Tax=Pristiophorus japonicus TaxID=55135 RepID=UPI00398E3858